MSGIEDRAKRLNAVAALMDEATGPGEESEPAEVSRFRELGIRLREMLEDEHFPDVVGVPPPAVTLPPDPESCPYCGKPYDE